MARFLVLCLSVLAIPGAAALWAAGGEALDHRHVWHLVGGVAAGLAAARVLLRRLPVLETFEHELTHALAALLLLRGVRRFKVTWRSGGYVEHQGGSTLGDDLIGFAPYVVPTFTLVTALAAPLVPAPWRSWWVAVAGATFGYHLLSNAREVRGSFTKARFRSAGTGDLVQSDIGRRGYVYSAGFILAAGMALHGIALWLMVRGFPGIPAWGHAFWSASLSAWGPLARVVH